MNATTLKRAGLVALCGMAAGLIVPRIQAADGDTATAGPGVAIALPTQPPKGAVVLYSGKADDLKANWYQRYTTDTPAWTVGEDGAAVPRKGDLISQREFGDHYLHVEYKTPTEGGGNAGVGIQGRYEIQIFNSFGRDPGAGGNAAFYSQKPPKFNASKKPGEWQNFDIIFRAPRFDTDGKVTEKARATLFHNGVLVHNNEEFNGMTGIQYGQFPQEAKTGPIVLQGDHEPVQFRNIWVVPLD